MATCNCAQAPKLIFPCSGASDVGELSDRAARKLSHKGVGNMYCLAGIGGGVGAMIESTKAASGVLAIDGCTVHCTRKTLEKAGIKDFTHVEITANGYKKGSSPVTEESIAKVAELSEKLFSGKGGCCG
ncbi:MAG: zinc-binding protein [Elusimicrobia bacterium RIFOXYB2_FULL_49_7]|nr:MAG: zinc-binding protein [Elusimicrobia bacterium RIFOXYB2_FULL_49_7]